MPWVIAIMMFLTVLTAAAGLGLRQVASHLRSGLAGRVTVQIVEADPYERGRQTSAATFALRRLNGVTHVERVDPKELKTLLEPWLGSSLNPSDIPMPDMIDADLTRTALNHVDLIEATVRKVAPSARIDRHAQWLAPLDQLIRLLKWLAVALVLLMATATAFTVVLAARATLDNHRETIDVMHLLGGTDSQIAGLFQRQIAADSLFGGIIGFVGAVLMVLLLGQRIESVGSDLIGAISLTPVGWMLLVLLPLAGTALAMVTARQTILNTLGRIL
jgi:cell division transport system permease protein